MTITKFVQNKNRMQRTMFPKTIKKRSAGTVYKTQFKHFLCGEKQYERESWLNYGNFK